MQNTSESILIINSNSHSIYGWFPQVQIVVSNAAKMYSTDFERKKLTAQIAAEIEASTFIAELKANSLDVDRATVANIAFVAFACESRAEP